MKSISIVFSKINISLIFLIAIFILITSRYITQIGLNYDELFFVNAALGGVGDEMLFKRIFNIPFMVLPDQGAIKSYLFFPIFKIWGINILSIRIPPIIFSAVTILIWYKIAKKIVGKNFWAIAFVALLASDPAFIMNTKVDLGPIVLQNLLIALTIYFYQQAFEKKSFNYFSLSLFMMIIGLINKINFLWFILSFLYVAALYDFAFISLICKRYYLRFSLVAAGFSIMLILVLIYLILPAALHFPIGGMTHVGLEQKIFYVPLLYLNTFNGFNNYNIIFYKELSAPSLVNIIELPCLVLWLLSLAIIKIFKIHNPAYQRYIKPLRFFLLLFVIEFLFLLFTPHTRSPSHAMILWPMAHLLFIIVLAAISETFLKRNVTLITGLAVLVVVASQCFTDYQFERAFKLDVNSPNDLWTPAIYPLSNYVNKHIDAYDNVMFADRGMSTPVFALAKNNFDRVKMHEFWSLFTDNADIRECNIFIHPFLNHTDRINKEWLYKTYYRGKHNLIVMFANQGLTPNVKDEFLAFTNLYHIQLELVASISDSDGNNIYSVFSATNISRFTK